MNSTIWRFAALIYGSPMALSVWMLPLEVGEALEKLFDRLGGVDLSANGRALRTDLWLNRLILTAGRTRSMATLSIDTVEIAELNEHQAEALRGLIATMGTA